MIYVLENIKGTCSSSATPVLASAAPHRLAYIYICIYIHTYIHIYLHLSIYLSIYDIFI